jgi:hypothetical protein
MMDQKAEQGQYVADFSNVEVITNVSQFLNLLNYPVYSAVNSFRGQANHKWRLSPSIERFISNDAPHIVDSRIYNWQSLEHILFEQFNQYSVPFMKSNDRNISDIDWLVHLQHHGMPTRLLDITSNPLCALFFAVENSRDDGVDGAVFFFCVHSTPMYELDSVVQEEENIANYFHCFYPRHINERISAQSGGFLLFPRPEKFDPFYELVTEDNEYVFTPDPNFDIKSKIRIPKEYKQKIRRDLARLGVSTRTIFPGLDGLSASIKQRVVDGFYGSDISPENYRNYGTEWR